jgi:hypothetical protein
VTLDAELIAAAPVVPKFDPETRPVTDDEVDPVFCSRISVTAAVAIPLVANPPKPRARPRAALEEN